MSLTVLSANIAWPLTLRMPHSTRERALEHSGLLTLFYTTTSADYFGDKKRASISRVKKFPQQM